MFDRVKDHHAKHFDQWRHKYLHLSLGEDAIYAQYFSSWILGREMPYGQYVSTQHNATMDIQLMGAFLTSCITPSNLRGFKKVTCGYHIKPIKWREIVK